MARPVKTLTHAGEDWQAILTGSCSYLEDYSIGVLFVAKTTNREAFGRLRGIPPDRFNQATAEQLHAALVAALSGDDD